MSTARAVTAGTPAFLAEVAMCRNDTCVGVDALGGVPIRIQRQTSAPSSPSRLSQSRGFCHEEY